MIDTIVFAQPIAVLGTSLRLDHFEAESGWYITEVPGGVVLYRPADDVRRLPEIPAFRVVGVGYCAPLDPQPAPPPIVEAPKPPAKARKR